MQNLDYKNLNEVIVHNQQEMDSIPDDYQGRIRLQETTERVWISKRYNLRVYIEAQASAVARENSSVVARENSSVEARENSSVEARENSSVVARENSSVVARENSSVVARENSSVVARENSSVVARENSSVEARENSSVEARENSSVVARENSSVVARENSSVVARENSSVEARENSSVVARENSSVEARENSSVEAWENSSVVAWENSSVVAWENSSVVARENSSVVARENSSVEARENSSVVARENSSVEAGGNVQVLDRTYDHKIEVSANARIVYMPNGLQEFINFFGIKVEDGVGTFYKAVRKTDEGVYYSDHDWDFIYEIGKEKEEPNIDRDTSEDCGRGIHISTLHFALNYGEDWNNLAILECQSKLEDIVCPDEVVGKVRTSKVMVVREVPLEECGVYGKILAKKLKRGAN